MSLIIALILGMYILYRCTYEKGYAVQNATCIDRKLKTQEDFYEKYSLSELEYNKLNKEVSFWRLTESLSELGNEIENVIGIKPGRRMILLACAAKSGKILPKYSMLSELNNGILSRTYVYDGLWRCEAKLDEEKTLEEMQAARLKFLIWYDELLVSNGFGHRLYISTWQGDHSGNGCRSFRIENGVMLKDYNKAQFFFGQFYWEPTTPGISCLR